MAREISGFFDSTEADVREYQADEFARKFRQVVTDGVRNGGYNLQVTAPGTGMTVEVNYGDGMVQGYDYWLVDDSTGKLTLTIDAPDTQKRIDRVVLRLDTNLGKREIYADVVKGVPGPSPAPPDLQRSNNIYELSLARITVDAGTVTILQPNVVDERYDSALCGIMNSLLQIDGGEFQAQAQAIIDGLAGMGYLPATGGTLGAYTENLVSLSGTVVNINLATGNMFSHTLSGDTTYSISGAVSGKAHGFTLLVTQPATARTITWPGSVKWQYGIKPSTGTKNKTYALTFLTVNGGTTWLGMFGGEF